MAEGKTGGGKGEGESSRDMGLQKEVMGLLTNLKGLQPLKDLFWSKLNYDRINDPVSTRAWTAPQKDNLAGEPLILAGDDSFKIIYCRLKGEKLYRAHERLIATRLLRDHPYAIFIFSDHDQQNWNFINVKYGDALEIEDDD